MRSDKVPPVTNADAHLPTPGEMVEQHWESVYRLLYSLSGNTHETEDMTQETFLRALSKLTSFQGGNLRAWLLRIASNLFFDERRRKQRSRSAPLPDNLAGDDPLVGQALESRERSAVVQTTLKELSELTRLVFHLRVQEELSFKEIAEMANTTEQSARWHMHHARTTLLARLGNDF